MKKIFLLFKIVLSIFKKPAYFYKMITLSNIKKVIYYMKNGNARHVLNQLKFRLGVFKSLNNKRFLSKHPVLKENYEKLVFNKYENPLVSIIIPVYNQFEYTYNCLESILNNTVDVEYEIIIADDVSSDKTRNIKEYVENITIVRNIENLGFLKNCNNAAKSAKGKYIHFLNNDTRVLDNWLSSLVDVLENDLLIGMVGSKLVFANGQLQEAGGIIWSDASGWNYGRLDDPSKSEYNYLKEVDYISGASILIRKNLWLEIGGFDERYAPAYYEDSDLAFEVRKHGFKVVYQPKSEVVHFEGISHGTDTNSGMKRYQIENKDKFYSKWKDVLENEHLSNGDSVFVARDRSQKKKHILIIDHYVPQFDKDAGSRATWQYVNYFIESGYHVTFVGDNFFPHQPYTEMLQGKGVEIIYGEYYRQNLQNWLQEINNFLDVVILARPHVSIKYIDIFQKKQRAKIVYLAHDLHFLRENREYELTKDISLKKSSLKWKEIELSVMKKVDETWLFSSEEAKILDEYDFNIKVVPLFLYREFANNFIDRGNNKSLIFVGGFSHKPNVDAINWFVNNVWYLVRNKIPDVNLLIVGSNPPKSILGLNFENNIVVKGFVDDEELKKLYNESKISIAPLRYGAGVKGKIVEALFYSIPIVTTSIGAEGLLEADDYMKIADVADDFSQKIIELYENESNSHYSKKSLKYCKKYFSYDRMNGII